MSHICEYTADRRITGDPCYSSAYKLSGKIYIHVKTMCRKFIFMVFVSDTIVATSISQPLFRKQIGHSVTAVLEEICYFELRRFVPDTGRDRAIGTNQGLSGNGKRNMHRRFFIYYRSFYVVSGGVIKIIKFSFPAKSCISIYPG